MRVHTEEVSAVTFFRDGRRVVTGSWDRTIQIWDVEKKASVRGPFEGHRDRVDSVAVSPDDKRIASGGRDRAVIIWDVDSKQMVFKPLVKHIGLVSSVCFTPDGKRLASGSNDGKVIIWDAETGTVLSRLQGGGPVFCVAFSPDWRKLASGIGRNIRVWSTDNAELLLRIDAHRDYVRSIVWSPDDLRLVSASDDKTVRFWDPSNEYQIGQPCTGHFNHINSLAISSDGSFIATASDDNTVCLWNAESHQQIGQALEHTARFAASPFLPTENCSRVETVMGIFSSGPSRTHFAQHSGRISHILRIAVRCCWAKTSMRRPDALC